VNASAALNPRINAMSMEYAQACGFVSEPARLGKSKARPRLESAVEITRGSFWAVGEVADLPDARRQAETRCRIRAGLRLDGSIQGLPAEVFALLKAPLLLPARTARCVTPRWTTANVHRDDDIQVGQAPHSGPGALIGGQVSDFDDSKPVKILHRGQVTKFFSRLVAWGAGRRCGRPVPLGGRSARATPSRHATRSGSPTWRSHVRIHRGAARHPAAANQVVQGLPTVGLVGKFGAERDESGCVEALAFETIYVGSEIARMVKSAVEGDPLPPSRTIAAAASRFARDPRDSARIRLGATRLEPSRSARGRR
jgi:hypothetical protein